MGKFIAPTEIQHLPHQHYCLSDTVPHSPTHTFCGTPGKILSKINLMPFFQAFFSRLFFHFPLSDYIAPEVILGLGYGTQVDYWALGVLMYEFFVGEPPFASYDPSSVAKKIIDSRVEYTKEMSPVMQDVIRALLQRDPSRRLGCLRGGTQDVMKHRFFRGFDWNGLQQRTMTAPYVPKAPKKIEKIGYRFSDRAKNVDWVVDLDS